jgi:hypothetical protein
MRETRSSGSVEGVVSNHDPYSDFEEHSIVLVAPTPHAFHYSVKKGRGTVLALMVYAPTGTSLRAPLFSWHPPEFAL